MHTRVDSWVHRRMWREPQGLIDKGGATHTTKAAEEEKEFPACANVTYRERTTKRSARDVSGTKTWKWKKNKTKRLKKICYGVLKWNEILYFEDAKHESKSPKKNRKEKGENAESGRKVFAVFAFAAGVVGKQSGRVSWRNWQGVRWKLGPCGIFVFLVCACNQSRPETYSSTFHLVLCLVSCSLPASLSFSHWRQRCAISCCLNRSTPICSQFHLRDVHNISFRCNLSGNPFFHFYSHSFIILINYFQL